MIRPGYLSSENAHSLLAQFGFNEVAESKPNPLLTHFWAPAPWMLEAAVVLQALVGEYFEAGLIAALLVFNALLSFVQGARAEAALAALKSRLAPTASVRLSGGLASGRRGDSLPILL